MSWSIYNNTGGNGKGDLVSPENLAAAQEHKITIDILAPNSQDNVLTSIDGFSNQAFNYSVDAEYSQILNWSDPDSLVFKLFKDTTQRNTSFYSGYGSKRMFNPGKSYVKLNLKFRAYDKPDIINDCDLLVKCCLPIISRNNFMLNNKPTEVIANGLKNIAAAGGTAAGDVVFGGNVGDAGGAILTELTNDLSTRMPPHLRVTIGSYFKKTEMVLTNCNFTFSKEFTRSRGITYPTYVDFDLQVESLYSSLAMGSSNTENANMQNQVFGPGFTTKQDSRVVIDAYVVDNPLAAITNDVKSASSIAVSTNDEAGSKDGNAIVDAWDTIKSWF